MLKKIFTFLFSITSWNLLAQSDNGYAISNAKTDYGISKTIVSKSLKKEMPLLVFLPSAYKTSNRNYPVVYMLHGVNDQPITDEGVRKLYHPGTGMQEAADMYQVIIVAPIVGRSFYVNNPTDTTQKFASFVGEDIPEFVDKNFRTMTSRQHRILAGFSMGGYGAISLLCRYPDRFAYALSRAGAVDLATGIKDLYWDEAAFTENIFGSYFTNPRAYHLNSCNNLTNKIKGRKDVGIVLEIGREDFLLSCNLALRNKLQTDGTPYIYAEYPGGHDFNANCIKSLFTHLQYFNKTIK